MFSSLPFINKHTGAVSVYGWCGRSSPPPSCKAKSSHFINAVNVRSKYSTNFTQRMYSKDWIFTGSEIKSVDPSNCLQWSLCVMDTLGPTKSVQIVKVS